MLAVVCPGQGSQSAGMLAPWLELPTVNSRLDAFAQAAMVDLRLHGTVSDAEVIRDTALAQPLIVAASLLSFAEIFAGLNHRLIAVTAGHSVGEFAAAAIAGVLDDVDAIRLVAARGRLMAEAAAAHHSGMAAVLGGQETEVLHAIEAAGLWPANMNGGGQIVAAGARDALAHLAENPPSRARVIPLQVAGAFHTPFMYDAMQNFEKISLDHAARNPEIAFLSNVDGTILGGATTGEEVMHRLTAQISAPVRWDLCQQSLTDQGITGILELAPGGVLVGLARRTLPDVERYAVKTPADLDEARVFVARHGES